MNLSGDRAGAAAKGDSVAPDMETVSVALCTFNGARFVGEQIASILHQSRPVDEIVIADDGSNDGTVELVEAQVAAFRGSPRLTILPIPLSSFGVAKNFERAVRAATGSIIVLADQDDVWSKNRVEHAVSAFESNPRILIVASDAAIIDADGQTLGETLFERMGVVSAAAEIASVDGFSALMKRSVVPGMAMACRRELFELSGDIPASWPHDYWWMMVGTSRAAFHMASGTLVKYRQHGENVVGAGSRRLSARVRRLIHEPSEAPRLLTQFTELLAYLSSIRGAEGTRRLIALVQQRVEFEQARADLARPAWRRIPALVKLLRRDPGYRDFESNGRWNALRDLIPPRPAATVLPEGSSRLDDTPRPAVVFVDRKKGRGGGQVVLEELCLRLEPAADLFVVTSPELAGRLKLPAKAEVLTSDSELVTLLKRRNSVVVSNTNADIAYSSRLARRLARAGAPTDVAAIIHNHPKTWLHGLLTRALLIRVDTILPVEPGLAPLSRRSLALPWLSTTAVKTSALPPTSMVKCFARPDPTKGLDLLPDIFKAISAEGVQCRVALGESLETHPAYVEKLRDELRPWLEEGHRTAEWIQPGDILLVPSVAGEAVCLSAQEAMTRGAAVVASRIGLMPTFERAGGAFRTFPIGDSAAASRAIDEIFSLPSKAFVDACQTNMDLIARQDGKWYGAVIAHLLASRDNPAEH